MRAIAPDLEFFMAPSLCFIIHLLAVLLSTPALAALPGITDFRTIPEQIPDTQLSSLLDVHIKTSDVVALGETVHGSENFLRMQTRLIRYLVSRHGFRLIVWENPTLRSLELARWVASCTKTKAPAPLDVLYMPTAADRPLFDWICDYNRSHPNDPIVFRGMDVWDRPWEHYGRVQNLGVRVGIEAALLGTIAKVCPAVPAASWPEIEALFARLQPDGKLFPEAAFEKCRSALTTVLDAARASGLANRKTKDAGSDDAFELAISASTLLGWLGFYQYNWADDILSWNARDEAQGRNLMLIMEKHGAARAIVSAHTSHVSHNRSRADWWGFGDIKSGIYFFSAMTRKKVFNIAFTAYEASGTQGHWMLPTAANSLDKTLHDAGHTFSLFASNAPFLSKHSRWWIQNQNAGSHENGVELVPADHFDAFIFFARSHLDHAFPARPMWQP
jgi:erythromycin esterase-like protein